MRRLAVVSAFLVLAAACDDADSPDDGAGASGTGGQSEGGSASDGGSTGEGGTPTNPLGATITLELDAFDVPANTERQVCKIVNLPAGADIDIVRMASTMQGTSHHFNVYKVLQGDVTAPVSESESTVHDCDPGADQLNGTAAYVFGSASPERVVDMPAGVAFHFVDQQRIILEQHVINAGAEPISGGASFDLVTAGEEAVIEHHADIMWMANWLISLPKLEETSLTEHCTVPYDVEVFGLMSHTHKLGTHFSIEKWTDGGTEHLYDSTDWAHPVYMQFAPMLSVNEGDGFQWTCTFQNSTMNDVEAGPESTDEMCMMFAYAYPKNSLEAEPYQCNKPFQQ